MSTVSDKEVLAALARVIDPERGKDIVSLGMVSGVQLREGHVAFAIEIDRARAAQLEPLRKAAEKAVEALPGVLSVTAAHATPRRRSRSPPASRRSSPSPRAKAASANRPPPSISPSR